MPAPRTVALSRLSACVAGFILRNAMQMNGNELRSANKARDHLRWASTSGNVQAAELHLTMAERLFHSASRRFK